ncbi:MAG: 2-hydroxycarboxylate transporter family protein, partial [Alphaproteobacteria bacterium]|nr:2-hydroxycarboxylate transporter family protein [Alphaproteobacteria bacterium]
MTNKSDTPTALEHQTDTTPLLIGIIPWPIYLVLLAVLTGFVILGKLPKDVSLMIAVLGVGGFTCGELGKRLPVISTLGAAAIFATFIPSYLTYAKILPKNVISAVNVFTKDSQFLYLYIAAIIVGSVLSMDRQVLVRGFLKVFIPMLAGTCAAFIVGIGIGLLFGMSLHD